MGKKVLLHNEAREALKKGIDIVAEAVKVTLGPRGRNVALDGFGGPTITNDGVSIAKDIELSDKFENMGAQIIREAAEKTNEAAGDGTTTATTLAHAMITEGLKKTAMGVNGTLMKIGIEKAAEDAVDILKKMAQPVKGDEIKHVAAISAESDEIGAIIADTIDKVGNDGVVTVEEGQTMGISSDVVEGMAFDRGYISPYMVTNTERMEADFKDPAIILVDKKVSTVKEIIPLIEQIAQSGKKDIVLIAEDVDGEALATFVVNKIRGAINVLAIKAPGFGDKRKEMLEDIAVTVGATVISEEKGMKLEEAGLEVIGRADVVRSKKDETIIVGGKGDKKAIAARVAQLKTQLENTTSKYDSEKLQERIAKLSGGVAVIRVGAATETEMKYLKHKIEDAVQATKAAIEEGIVPGGGSALAKTAKALGAKVEKAKDEMKAGYQLVAKSLLMPMEQILINAGQEDEAKVIVQNVASGYYVDAKGDKHTHAGLGYDARKGEYVEDMIKAGIIDPVKVTRNALQNAASAAAIFLTTEVAIADEPGKDNGPTMGGGMPGMGGMGGMM